MAETLTLTRGDCTIAWERFETPAVAEAAPALLLHGFGMDRRAMEGLARALAARTQLGPVLGLDLRGHGETRTPDRDDAHGYPDMRDDLLALLEQEAPAGAHLVGHSMGGQVALMAAIERPDRVRSLSLIGAGPCRAVVHEKEKRSWQRIAELFASGDRARMLEALAAAAPTEDPRLTPEALYGASRGDRLARVVRGAFLQVEDNHDACRDLSTPTLLIAGEADAGWLEPTRQLAELLPDASLRIIEGAGHVVHLEQEDDCAQHIADFLT